jgi:hypothetical protein
MNNISRSIVAWQVGGEESWPWKRNCGLLNVGVVFRGEEQSLFRTFCPRSVFSFSENKIVQVIMDVNSCLGVSIMTWGAKLETHCGVDRVVLRMRRLSLLSGPDIHPSSRRFQKTQRCSAVIHTSCMAFDKSHDTAAVVFMLRGRRGTQAMG